MSGYRLKADRPGLINTARRIDFQFAGRKLQGFEGDTLASALIASGVRTIARSYKLHRPRGVFTCGPEEPSAIVDVGVGADRTPVTRATDVELFDGLIADCGNAWPSVDLDFSAATAKFARFMPPGFYYKTFMWPNWHLFEPKVRNMAGLGIAPQGRDRDRYDEVSIDTDVLVIGGGASGVAAARTAAAAGSGTVLLESDKALGGWQRWATQQDTESWREDLARAGVQVLVRTTAFGVYDHHFVTALEVLPKGSDVRERVWKIRASHIVLATGAFERPMLFPDNDRPGVMLAGAVQRYASDYAAACGKRVLLAVNADSGYATAAALLRAGIAVAGIADTRPEGSRGAHTAIPAGVPHWHDAFVVGVEGKSSVHSAQLLAGGQVRSIDADTIACAGGLTPNVNLFSQAGGKLRWVDESAMFVPHGAPAGIASVGACAGVFDEAAASMHAEESVRALLAGASIPAAPVGGVGTCLADTHPAPAALEKGARKGKIFVDLQSDVSSDDIRIAASENYRSVEHLKRYTATGMGTDQGKTSNINALVRLGAHTAREPAQVGTTKFRPPFKPITMGAVVGGRSGERYRPRRQLQARTWHEQRGALFEEFGGWMRPAAYPREGENLEQAALREALAVRHGAGLFDGSPLGKIEVAGPDAAAFLDLMYVGTMSTLKPGHGRYGLLLNENGVIVDDGIVVRLSEQHFWVNTTSGGVERTAAAFDEWLQCEFVDMRVAVIPVTGQWANITVAGPLAWKLLQELGFPAEFAPSHMKHMTMQGTEIDGVPLRVLRASFCGELSYEINLPPSYAQELLDRLWEVGKQFDVTAYGVEALQILRTEKAYLHVGADTDGTTQPADVGFDRGIEKKAANFVGRRSLLRPASRDANRMQLVGMRPVDRRTRLPVGAQVAPAPLPCETEGWVTSSYFSPILGEPVALGMLRRGRSRTGERIRLHHMGAWLEAEVVETPFYDPAGERLNGA
ncbi:2Fe-2S iron-sulfur cluster-binding protein [Herbaspirillum sp. ST 5-3]|uniref:2Fe-2S iron-sulfur cluster-binding protein n=1 Tax=Oxalobacteraceae TaxID=75682 RepID=UPI0010A38289|nr:2Fe-2S iron-sulfur cluster-binding protein [Herbaspirillum sp. ST 5-3]